MFIVSPVVRVHSWEILMLRDFIRETVNSRLENQMYQINNNDK